MAHGRFDFWTNLLGLGVPQPFVPNFIFHPLSPLLNVMSAAAWARLLIVAHVIAGAAGMWCVARRAGASYLATAFCVVTFLLATPAQNYVVTDFWPSHFIVWTMAPWLLWLGWTVLECERSELRTWSVAAGLAGGLAIANTNPGHILVYFTVLAGLLFGRWRGLKPRLGWLILSALIALAIASPNLVQLARERMLFARGLPLANLPAPLPLSTVASAFFSPLVDADPDLRFSRTLFFGGPFALLCLGGCVLFARRRPDLVITVVISAVLLFTRLLPIPFASARFHYRDPLTLTGILLAALTLDVLIANRRWKAIGIGLCVIQAAVLIGTAWPDLARATIPDARRVEWFRGGSGATATADALVALSPPGRLLFSPAVDEEITRNNNVARLFGTNALAYRGVPVVNGWFKGVSTGLVWPDQRMFYGAIHTPPQLLHSVATLDALGIRYIIASADETVGDRLHRRGVVKAGSGLDLVIYENTDAWPDAFLVDAAAETVPRLRLPGCENDRVLCADLTPLAEHRIGDYVGVTAGSAATDVSFPGVDEPRLLVVSQMFREDWVAAAGARTLETVSVAGGLLGVRVPPAVSAVQLRYRPLSLIVATAIAGFVLAAAVIFLIVTSAIRNVSSFGAVRPDPVRRR